MKKLILCVSLLAAAVAANATLYTTNWNSSFGNGTTIPDNNLSGDWNSAEGVGGTCPRGRALWAFGSLKEASLHRRASILIAAKPALIAFQHA